MRDSRSHALLATLALLPSVKADTASADWILYTPDGFYTGSAGAERFVRRRDGEKALPEAVQAELYRDARRVAESLNRP